MEQDQANGPELQHIDVGGRSDLDQRVLYSAVVIPGSWQ